MVSLSRGDYLSAASFLGICGMIATFGFDGFFILYRFSGRLDSSFVSHCRAAKTAGEIYFY